MTVAVYGYQSCYVHSAVDSCSLEVMAIPVRIDNRLPAIVKGCVLARGLAFHQFGVAVEHMPMEGIHCVVSLVIDRDVLEVVVEVLVLQVVQIR